MKESNLSAVILALIYIGAANQWILPMFFNVGHVLYSKFYALYDSGVLFMVKSSKI